MVRHPDRNQSTVTGYREVFGMANVVASAVSHQDSERLKRLDRPQTLNLLQGHKLILAEFAIALPASN